MPSPGLQLLLWLSLCLALGTWLGPRAAEWGGRRAAADNLLEVVLGDARRMFATHFFVKADVYFHSGYYPSLFDEKPEDAGHAHLTDEHSEADLAAHEAHMNFLGPPRDWIDAFGRHFYLTEHTELSGGKEKEIIPWLKLSAQLDPQRPETYAVAAYWLRSHLGRVADAEAFLREGIRANPDSYELLFELGKLALENHRQPDRARNLWELALRKWDKTEAGKKEPDIHGRRQILLRLARLEEQEGNLTAAIRYLEELKPTAPHREVIQQQIDELRARLAGPSSPPQP